MRTEFRAVASVWFTLGDIRLQMQKYATQIESVRKMAESHVRRCGNDPAEMTQAFLFAEDRFVGVRFASGAAETRWIIGSELVELLRNKSVVAKMPIAEPETARKAA